MSWEQEYDRAARLHDRRIEADFDPRFGREREEDVEPCEECGGVHGVHWHEGAGEMLCDRCVTENAQACGDWTKEDIEAAKRIGVSHPEKPTA